MMASNSKSSLPVEDLGREERCTQRGLEDCAYAPGCPGKEHDSPLPVAHLENGGEKRAKSRANLGDRTFPAGRPA